MKLLKHYREQKRLQRLPMLFAQDLDVISGALRSGSSLIQAIQAAAHSGVGPMAEEWNSLLKEIRLGSSLEQALLHLEQRNPIGPIQSFTSGVSLLQGAGGPLAGMLQTVAQTVRQEAAFQGKLRAMTAQGRLSGYVVSVMPFVILAVLHVLSPELMQPLFNTAIGYALLVIVVLLVGIGGFLIKMFVTIEV
jgi:tight adherence protein B